MGSQSEKVPGVPNPSCEQSPMCVHVRARNSGIVCHFRGMLMGEPRAPEHQGWEKLRDPVKSIPASTVVQMDAQMETYSVRGRSGSQSGASVCPPEQYVPAALGGGGGALPVRAGGWPQSRALGPFPQVLGAPAHACAPSLCLDGGWGTCVRRCVELWLRWGSEFQMVVCYLLDRRPQATSLGPSVLQFLHL